MGRNNFQLNGVLVRRELYRLACLLAADGVLFEMAKGGDSTGLALRKEFLVDEIVHLLVITATYNRVRLDDKQENSITSKLGLKVCGQLEPDIVGETTLQLTFREACNKIIHAVNIVPETAGDPAEHPISDLFILRGKRDRQTWQAFLDINRYLSFSVANFQDEF